MTWKLRTTVLFLGLAVALGLAGCVSTTDDRPDASEADESVPDVPAPGASAKAELAALGGSGVSGWVSFTEVDGGVQVEAHVMGLTPGDHGFHIHQYGDCSSPDGKSAGGHFNPADTSHGGPGDKVAHAGDLGNLTADEEGHAEHSIWSDRISLGDGPNSVLGRGVIVHEKADDLTSQPTGAAGGRVACGVIMLEGGDTEPVTASEG